MASRRRPKDPDDCENPACKDVSDMLKKGRALGRKKRADDAKRDAASRAAAANEEGGGEGVAPATAAGAAAGAAAAVAAAAAAAAASASDDGCPLDKGELGAATWGLMHTTAAHYPEKPSKGTQDHAKALFASLAALYPCTYCRKDFEEEIHKQPPDVGSRLALSLWTCRQHNLVNEKIGKPTFECTLPVLDERWKTGKKSCWEEGGT